MSLSEGVDEALYYDEDGEPLGCDNVRPGPFPGFLSPPRCIRDAGHLEGRYPHDQHEGNGQGGAIYWPVLPGDLDPPQYARKAPGTRVTWYSEIQRGVCTGEVDEISGQDAKVKLDGTVIYDWVPLTWLTPLST